MIFLNNVITFLKQQLKKTPVYLKSFIIKTHNFFNIHPILMYIIYSFAVVLITEAFNRRSVSAAFTFMIQRPAVFLLGYLLVLSLISVSHFLKKRNFWKYFIAVLVVIISLISYIMFSFRMMPFSFNDLILIRSTFTILPLYLNLIQIILIIVLVALIVLISVYMYKKCKPVQINIKKDMIFPICIIVVTVIYFCSARATGMVDNKVSGLANKYEHNGFVYCFISSVIERGMTEPKEYSNSEVASIVHDVNTGEECKSQKPNIIFLQLESFFDVNNIKAYTYSENPVPVFNNLQNNFSHGYLNVPTFSAGTANTEFEVISGMDVDFFGIGEVAYQTVVKDLPIETVCHILKSNGYSTHAIHNNSASFYDRNLIYQNLGFDTFTSLEYMYNVEYNALGWARDTVIETAIEDCLSSTKNNDFIYAVGVQSHGVYSENLVDSAREITVTGIEDENTKKSFEYYLGQLREVDEFVGNLIKSLQNRNEPTLLVVFGDHLPGFEVDDSQLHNNSKYQTQYALWSNFDMDCIVKDLCSYQLYSYILERLDIDGGTISKLHQKYSYTDNEEYSNSLEIIQYDMLDGNGISYSKQRPDPVNTKMGIKKIEIEEAEYAAEKLYIKGNNFNEFSQVTIDEKNYETTYINSNELIVEDVLLEISSPVYAEVSQIDQKGRILSSTNKVLIEHKENRQ